MNPFETFLVIAIIPAGLIAAGYWLAARLPCEGSAERLCFALLAGLASLLWVVSAVNAVLPMSGPWGAFCLGLCVVDLRHRERRSALGRDLRIVFFSYRGMAVLLGAWLFVGWLLWPLVQRPAIVFYDGTSGHDAFFWVTGAEHLKRQGYLQDPLADAMHPLYFSVQSITGWHPPWGRMGAEGLLALLSNVVGASPLKIYIGATAALFAPWVAAVFLTARTFLTTRFSLPVALALVTLQPIFIFFHGNANLPNLLGILLGATVVVATARVASDASPRPWPWLTLLALAVHGVLVVYPEIAPAIALPCILLWMRGWQTRGWRPGAAGAVAVIFAAIAGLALNPITTFRAWNGFKCSLDAVHHPERWQNIFESVVPAARMPAMATLSVHFGNDLGTIGGAIGSALLLLGVLFTLRRARDRIGTVALFSGAALMIIYTVGTHLDYGWQKTVQFSGVFIATVLPVGALAAALGARPVIRALLGGGLAGIFFYAVVVNGLEAHKWSQRKYLTDDWFELRAYAREHLRNAPVLVDSTTFSLPFFSSMWATYFLADSRVYFVNTDPKSAGYLKTPVLTHPPDFLQAPRLILVDAGWTERAGRRPVWRSGALALISPENVNP